MSRSRKNIAQDSSGSKWAKRVMKRQGSLHESILERASGSKGHSMAGRDNLSKTLKRFNRSG